MTKSFTFKKILLLMSSAGIVGFSQYVSAAAFQLWEQDGASIGNYHAGRAAIAEDASTAYYNPAGLIRIHNQQLVLGAVPLVTDIKFNGTVNVNTAGIGGIGPVNSTSQGGGFHFVPDFHYAAPITDKLVFGFSIFAPFGLKTDYGTQPYTRYAATLTSFKVIDFSPSLGMAFNDKFSVGIGFDIQRANAEFDLAAGNGLIDAIAGTNMDTYGQNTGSNHGYGFHAGALYQFTPDTRLGIGYVSKVVHVLHGSSHFFGPLANNLLGGTQVSPSLRAKIVLPPTTTVSLFHTINPVWDVMGSISLTQWNVIQNLTLTGVAAIIDGSSSNNVTVTIPQRYRNTWNYAAGANYHVNEQWMIRTGVGFDQTPSNNQDRNLQLPDSDRLAAAVGAHFQATKTLAFDAGWNHIFVMNTRIRNNLVVVGDQTTLVNGSVHSSADIYGFQMKWNIV